MSLPDRHVVNPRLRPRRGPGLLPTLLLVFLWGSAASGADEPKKIGVTESVEVNLIQLEVTVWPKKPDSDACLGLTVDDFELFVDYKPQKIYAVDSLGAAQETYTLATPLAGESSGGGLSFVLFFDLWHLDLFWRSFPACPRTTPLAFEEARRFVREEFRKGDRLLLVTTAGWPVVHYGWIETQADALQALNRLEKNRQVISPRQEHSHHNEWIAGIESLFLALGRYPGRKDVIYLADDFRFDDVAMRMYEIAGRAQSNGVVVNAVDLVASCRSIPGPGCIREGGGAGCSEFSHPVALSPLSRDTGGRLFLTDRIASAARELRSMRECRYLVSFPRDSRKSRRSPWITLNLRRELRKVLTLYAPSSYETAAKAPSQADQDDALFLLPRFGRGIGAEVALWPYRPGGKKGKEWKSFVLARVERTDDEPWPGELTEITANVLVHKQSKVYGGYEKRMAGDELEAFRTKDGKRLILFPVDGLRPGDMTVDFTVTGNVKEISANVRRSFDVPKPPEPGEARPWFLSDQFGRLGENAVLIPSFDDVVTPDEFVSFIGYGCRSKNGAPESYTGRLVPFSGGAPVPIPVTWLDRPGGLRDGCGWLVAKVGSPLQPGLWTFEPPANLGGRDGSPGVQFNVVSATATEEVVPAELKPE